MKASFIIVLLLSSLDANSQNKYAMAYNSEAYMSIWKKPTFELREMGRCNSRDTIQLIEYSGGQYFKIKTLRKDSVTGYLNINFLAADSVAVAFINEYKKNNNSFVDRLEYKPLPEKQKKQEKVRTFESSGTQTYTPKEIQTGPRGGKYYINSNGNKTYLKKK